MNGVSCRAFGVVVGGTKDGSALLAELAEGSEFSAEFLGDPNNQIPWDSFTEIVGRLANKIGGAEALSELGANNVSTASFSIFRYVGRAIFHPRDLYYIGARWMGPSLFPMITAAMRELPDGRLIQQLTISEGHRDCQPLFHIIHGALVAAPRAWGHDSSEVTLELAKNSATYTIQPRSANTGSLGRVIRSLRAFVAFPSMLRELQQQQSSIEANYRELHDAHDKIATQAAELTKVNAIGGRLAAQIDLDHVVDILIQILLDELAVVGAELRLIRSTLPSQSGVIETGNHPQLFRQAGDTDGMPSHRYLLETAAHPLGSLWVWRTNTINSNASDALLDRLIPWISMALDNARTYEGLERHATDLEHRVKERTARLLSANHHLVREIEERKRATDALLQSEAQLRASERLASIGTLAAGIAHEINNPIGSILAAAQLAQIVRDDSDGPAQIAESLEGIIGEAKRCGEIVRSVLQFSRDEPTEKWANQTNAIIAHSVRFAKPFAEQNHAQIELHLPSQSPWAIVNPIQIEQAIVNLLRNAIESGGTRIRVDVRELEAESKMLIEIQDNGLGISDHDRLRIFEPFYTTKQDVGGTGLGLSVVHGIATEHRGTLKLDTSARLGTAVLLELPTCPAPTRALEEKVDDERNS